MTAPQSWVPGVGPGHPFGVHHLPYGIAPSGPVVRIGDYALDLGEVTARLAPDLEPLLHGASLNPLLAAGPDTWRALRDSLQGWLAHERHRGDVEPFLVPVADLPMSLPFEVADYVDFYASEHHATNVGHLFRPGTPPLPKSWKHLPIGYHGRAGTVVVSGTDVVRPAGQLGPGRFGPCERLDLEAEVGFVVGAGSGLGEPIPLAAFAGHVFGVCLVNDWSARDIQAWEYVPLGPFLGKSFATSIAAWITPLAALADARVPTPPRDPLPLPYLDDAADPWALDIAVEISLNGELISSPPFAGMYWTPAQMLAHLTSNGANVRPGDLYASGTVSGPHRHQRGSLLELAWGGAEPLTLTDGTQRTFLQDGDEVVLAATAPTRHGRIELGEVRGRVLG